MRMERKGRGPTSKGRGWEKEEKGREKEGRGGACPTNKKSFPHPCAGAMNVNIHTTDSNRMRKKSNQ